MTITNISDGERDAKRKVGVLVNYAHHQAETIELLRGEATVLRYLLRECLDPLATMADGEHEDRESWQRIQHLHDTIVQVLAPAGAQPAADAGQGDLLGPAPTLAKDDGQSS